MRQRSDQRLASIWALYGLATHPSNVSLEVPDGSAIDQAARLEVTEKCPALLDTRQSCLFSLFRGQGCLLCV